MNLEPLSQSLRYGGSESLGVPPRSLKVPPVNELTESLPKQLHLSHVHHHAHAPLQNIAGYVPREYSTIYIYIYISHCPLGPQKCENNMKIKTNAYENNVMWHFHFISISFSMIFTFWGSPRSGSQISHYFHIPVHIVLFASYYDTGCF